MSLEDWGNIKHKFLNGSLLIGNGASRAIWKDFSYPTLLETAATLPLEHKLGDTDLAIFRQLRTENFESALAALLTAELVGNALGHNTRKIRLRYEAIRKALVEAVHAVHIPWAKIRKTTFERIRQGLRLYKEVFSTNYDLLIYWSIMDDDANGFSDFFRGNPCQFLPSNTRVPSEVTKILYLHGALHICHDLSGSIFKNVSVPGRDLLDQFTYPLEEGKVPLFITEGTAEQKLERIYRSDYLWFAYSTFRRCQRPLTVFGHSLGESDNHLVEAMRERGKRPIAISIWPGDGLKRVEELKDYYCSRLPEADKFFFDSTTHPLGSPELKVEPPKENDEIEMDDLPF